ncbi:MAG: hypothetical protein HY770_06620, partial [Chitinivibrionia bacterium]|nr:hypothetical protein [Chitinivibrionia bacterium]
PAVVVSLVMSLSWVGINRNPAKSVSRFENLLAFEKASAAQGYTQLAFYQANQGNMLAAITASEKAYSLDSSPGNFLNASIFYLSSEDTVRAIELLDRSIKDHPDAHTNRQALVSLLDQTARFADMTRVCKEGIQQQPDEPQYYYFLGKSYLYRGNLREGLLALKKCKDMSPPEPIPAYIDSLLARIRKVK